MTKFCIKPDPILCIIGVLSRLPNQQHNKWLSAAFAVAKMFIFCKWRDSSALHIQDWTDALLKIAQLEKVICMNIGSLVTKYGRPS